METLVVKPTALRKTMSVVTAVATIAVLSGLLLIPIHRAGAVAPADYGLTEGDFIRATGDIDIYIVNEHGFKRLVLSPEICKQYGHLGRRGCFDAVKEVSPTTRDAFNTSWYFTNGETNDGKVYVLVTTGEDSADLHHLDMSGSEFRSQGGDFQGVFLFNTLEQNTYEPNVPALTNLSQVPAQFVRDDTATPVGGTMSVSLSPDNPSARTVTKNAQGLDLLGVRFTGNGTVNSMTFERRGPGATGDFDNVYVYRGAERLTSGKSLTSSTGRVTFSNLGLLVNGTLDVTLVGDLSATAGNVNYFQLVSVDATETVGGTPVDGNNISISGQDGGGVTLTTSGSLSNPTVGQKQAQVGEFKLTANTEGASVRRFTLFQNGTISAADTSNWTLKVKGKSNTWSGFINSDDRVVFDLGDGFFVAKGDNEVFEVYADVSGDPDETVDLYFENDADTLAIGDQFGFGMAVTDDDVDSTNTVGKTTLQGGTVTLAFNGPNSSTIGTDTDDTEFLNYSMTAQTNVEVRKTEFTLCRDTTGNGTYNDSADTTDGWADIDDFKVADVDSGVVLMGPVDGSSFTTSDAGSCPDAATGAQWGSTDTFDLSAGETLNLSVTADVKLDNTRDGLDLASGGIVKVILDDYTDDTPSTTVMKFPDSNKAVQDADITPGADISGNNMTLSASALTLGLSGSPTSKTFIKGTENVDMVGFTFKSDPASPLTVTDITLTGYVKDESGDTSNEGVDTNDSGVSIANAVSNVRLMDGSTDISSGATVTNNLNVDDTGTMKFGNLNWDIAAGETKTLTVRVDLTNNAASGSNGDFYAFDINATTDVTAVDGNNNTVNAGSADPNNATSPTVEMTVKNSGTLAEAQGNNQISSQALYWGQNGVDVAKFKFTSTNEPFYLEDLVFQVDNDDAAADFKNNVSTLHISYTNENGNTVTDSRTPDNNASASFSWSSTDVNRPYVPQDSSMTITVSYDLKTNTEGGTNDKAFSVELNGGDASMFKARGSSGNTKTGADISDVDSNNMRVYRVYPKITRTDSYTDDLLTGFTDVLRFQVEAMGTSDATMKLGDGSGTSGSGSLKFEIVASGSEAGGDPTFNVYDHGTGELVDTGTITNATDPSPAASLTVDFSSTSNGVALSGGDSKEFRVEVDLTKFADDGDYFRLDLLDNEDDLIQWQSNDLDTSSKKNILRDSALPLRGHTFVNPS